MRRVLLLLALLGALALPAAAQAKGVDARLAALVAALGDASNAQARSNAYMSLMREKPPGVPALIAESAPRFDLQGQEYGLWVLSVYPLEDAEPAMKKLLADKSPLLELGAAAWFWRQNARDALEHLVKPFARKDASLEVRRALLRHVYGIREPKLGAAVRAWLAPETDPQLLEDALYHLLFVEDGETRARVLELAATPALSEGAGAACAAYLLAVGDDTRGAALVALVAADDGSVLARLQRFFVKAPRLPAELVAAIAKVAESSRTPYLAQTAIGVLAQHAGQKEIPVLERLMGSPDLVVAKAALDALQKRGVGISHETLARMLDSKESQRALAAADALRREDDLSGFERVLAIVKAGGTEKAEAVRVLAKFRRRAALAPLVDALEDADAGVRMAAEQGLAALLPSLFPYRRFDLATSGYQSQAAPAARAAGVQKIRAWVAANLKS